MPASPSVRNLATLQAQDILYYKTQILESRKISLWLKIKLVLFAGIGDFRFYTNALCDIALGFERLYYECAINTLRNKIAKDKKSLAILQRQDILSTLKALSKIELETHLINKYKGLELSEFSLQDLSAKSSDFIAQYPIICSTTHSVASSLNPALEFDYLICDEASQVDLATGALALSMTKNIVIVGDTKQLPNVIPNELVLKIQALNDSYKIVPCYDYLVHSFLTSICARFENVPKVLLKEHYRCHPKIIEFCNQKFYDNELVILSSDEGSENDAISLHFTTTGNHARGRLNQREIDEIISSILPTLKATLKEEQIGIITPYNEQKNALERALGKSKIQVDTVHKFQGREKDPLSLA